MQSRHSEVRSETPFSQPREFLVEVYGPLFAALGRLTLPSPVRLSDFINEREGFLRLTDVEFITDGDLGGHHGTGQRPDPIPY